MLIHSKSDVLPVAHLDEFLPPLGRWLTFGGLSILLVGGLAVPIASVIKYKETVRTQASIRPVGELKLVQAATEGTITRIVVRENQRVKRGEAIAFIDNSRLQTKKGQLQNNIRQAKLQVIQINAQITALMGQIGAESDRIDRTVASAKAELSQRQRDYRDKQITSNAEVEESGANLKMAQEELQKAQADLKSTQANLSSAQAAFDAATSKRDRYRSIAQEGALSQDQLEETQLLAKQQEQTVDAQKAAVQAQEQMVEKLQQEIEAAQARQRRTQAALNPSSAEVTIATERIVQEKAAGEATLATLNKEHEALIQKRIEINQQLAQDSQELQQIDKDISQTTIKATADGIVAKLNLRNREQTVRLGEEIAQIVPHNAHLVVKAAVEPSDIGKLQKGQSVQMRVSACPYPDYGTLRGMVSQISEDVMKTSESATDSLPTSPNPKVAFYQVTIEPKNLSLGQGANQCIIQLGMEGRADIITREETFLKFLLRKGRLITGY